MLISHCLASARSTEPTQPEVHLQMADAVLKGMDEGHTSLAYPADGEANTEGLQTAPLMGFRLHPWVLVSSGHLHPAWQTLLH